MFIPKHLLDKSMYISDGIKDIKAFEERSKPECPKVSMEHLYHIEDMIIKYSPYMASYDVYRTQSYNTDEFSYTEIFKNAIFLTPQCSELAFKMCQKALENYNGNLEDDTKKIVSWINSDDKYELDRIVAQDGDFPSIMFLPGTNALDKVVDFYELAKWIYLDQECMIKPHPLTAKDQLSFLSKLTTKSRIFPMDMSGADLLKQARRVYTTGMSELGLIAKLLDKEVIDITSFINNADATYAPLYRYLNYPYTKDDLVKVLANPEWSGVFFHQDVDLDKKIKAYINNFMELQDTQRSVSNTDYVTAALYKLNRDFKDKSSSWHDEKTGELKLPNHDQLRLAKD